MNSHGLARWLAGLAGLCIILTGAGVAFRWTLIPLHLDSRVVGSTWVDSTTGHLRALTLDDDSTVILTRTFIEADGGDAALLGVTVRKERWQRQVHIGDQVVDLPVPLDIWRTIIAVSVPVTISWWLRRRAWGSEASPNRFR